MTYPKFQTVNIPGFDPARVFAGMEPMRPSQKAESQSLVGRYRLLGDTLDDAAGEAFDKTAKLMGLPYPGGPALAALAGQGVPGRFRFSRPMTDRPGLDFSFSGLKTQVLLAWQNSDRTDQTRADIARGFEDALVDTLRIKCLRALDATDARSLVIAGGVGANRRLREQLHLAAAERGFRVYFPRPEFCTDNGAMIAWAGAERLALGLIDTMDTPPRARWRLDANAAAPTGYANTRAGF